MGLIGFTRRFLGRSSCIRSLHTSRRRLSTLPPADSSLDIHSDPYPDYGTYSIILPPEPFQFGTSHIPVLPVSPSIQRPQYAIERKDKSDTETKDPWEGDGRIELNTDEEKRVRKAAGLAKSVREFVGGLVKVCLPFPLPVPRFNYLFGCRLE